MTERASFTGLTGTLPKELARNMVYICQNPQVSFLSFRQSSEALLLLPGGLRGASNGGRPAPACEPFGGTGVGIAPLVGGIA